MTHDDEKDTTMTEQDQQEETTMIDQAQQDQNTPQDTPAQPPATEDTPTTPEDQDEPQDDQDDEPQPNREAAKYRRRLRETETERDQLTTDLDQARADLDQLRWALLDTTRPGGVTAEAMRKLGHTTEEFFAEDGTVDQDAYRAAARAATQALGIRQNHVPTEGRPVRGTVSGGTSFADAISGHGNS